jgi:ABC-type uncharacterized transport system ATPase subunit
VRVTGTGIDSEVAQRAASLPGILDVTAADGTLAVKLAEGARPAELVALLVQHGVAIDEVRRNRQTLEEAFLELVSDDAASARPGDRR